jgi:UrcA family protein
MPRIHPTIGAAAIAALMTFSYPAAAQPGAAHLVITGEESPWVTQTSVTHLGDLDLSRSSGAHEALARIHTAARRVCSPIDGAVQGAGQFEMFNACVAQAELRAVAEVDAPALTSLYRRAGTSVVASSGDLFH